MSNIHVSRINRGWVIRSHEHVTAAEFAKALAPIRADGGGAVRWFVCEPTTDELACAKSHGLTPSAPLLHMRCALPLAPTHRLPEGFTTRPFRPGTDNDEWLALNARAFAGHPEQGHWTPAVLTERITEPWFDANGFLILDINGAMAGFCWTKTHAHSGPHDHNVHDHAVHDHNTADPAGEIYVVGVDPAHHGKGLGRALTIAGFAHLAHRGLRTGMLYVDGDNTPAIALYSSLGMSIAHRDAVFVGSISAN